MPVAKTLGKYDFSQVPELNNAQFRQLCETTDWVDAGENLLLFELIAHRYERGSLVITSNHPFSTWGGIFVDETMAVAAADRLSHHGYMFELKGESYSKKAAKAVTKVA